MAGTVHPAPGLARWRPDLTFRQADDTLGEQQPHLVRRDRITGLKAVFTRGIDSFLSEDTFATTRSAGSASAQG